MSLIFNLALELVLFWQQKHTTAAQDLNRYANQDKTNHPVFYKEGRREFRRPTVRVVCAHFFLPCFGHSTIRNVI